MSQSVKQDGDDTRKEAELAFQAINGGDDIELEHLVAHHQKNPEKYSDWLSIW